MSSQNPSQAFGSTITTMLTTTTIPLTRLKAGQQACIQSIDDPEATLTACRLGLLTGQSVYVLANVPGGPVVIQKDGMELALGRALCKAIQVLPQ